ncbi:MAG: hypothetical protein JWM28_532 [Chitinophagaceae bacterium]|nr:hypothetical protein [Chitinophagaceae bacterium]
MKLKLWLLLLCLLGIGMFSYAQNRKKESKPTVEKGDDLIPVTVKSSKKHRKPPPPPPKVGKDGKLLPHPKVEMVKFAPPRIVKDKQNVPPPPPPKRGAVKFAPPKIVKDKQNVPPPPKNDITHFKAPKTKVKAEKPVKPEAPPPTDFRG